jgi:hypothetical protein
MRIATTATAIHLLMIRHPVAAGQGRKSPGRWPKVTTSLKARMAGLLS